MIKGNWKLFEPFLDGLKAMGFRQAKKDDKKEKMEQLVEESKSADFLHNGLVELPDLKLEKMEVNAQSDEQIAEQAKDMLAEFEQHSRSAIELEAQKGKDDLKNYMQTLDDNKLSSEQYTDELAKQQKESASNEALKRGLARSSIVLNQLAAVDKEKADRLSAINENYQKEIAQANYMIDQLETQKQVAIKNLEATLATKLAMQISELTDKRDKKIEEAIKYNNTIAETLANYNVNKQKTTADIEQTKTETAQKQADLYTSDSYKEYLEEVRYGYIRDYLYSLDKQKAINELKNNEYYKQNLNDYYYQKLLSELKGR